MEAIAELIEVNGFCRVTDLAEYFDVSHVTVNRAVARFQRAGLVTTEPYAPIELTKQGAQLAESSRQRHAIVYEFLLALGVNEKAAATDTEGIEHHVSAETLQRMKLFAKQAKSKGR